MIFCSPRNNFWQIFWALVKLSLYILFFIRNLHVVINHCCGKKFFLQLGKALFGLKLCFFYYFIFSFYAVPVVYESSQARGQIGAAAAGLHHGHSNTRSLTHWVGPGITSSWRLCQVLNPLSYNGNSYAGLFEQLILPTRGLVTLWLRAHSRDGRENSRWKNKMICRLLGLQSQVQRDNNHHFGE